MRYYIVIICVVTAFYSQGKALAAGTLYDVSIFLNQKHPFTIEKQNISTNVLNEKGSQNVFTNVQNKKRAIKTNSVDERLDRNSSSETITSNPLWGYISELRMGALAHDVGPFSAKEESGIDTNIEMLFSSPDFLEIIWSPRPQLGINYNSSGDTSQAYLGLEWEYGFWDGWFTSFSFGGAVHDGHLVGNTEDAPNSKSLGCRFLFREALNLGYRFRGHHAVMLHLDHISNASLCEKETRDGSEFGRHTTVLNEGLETFGVRYGYMF